MSRLRRHRHASPRTRRRGDPTAAPPAPSPPRPRRRARSREHRIALALARTALAGTLVAGITAFAVGSTGRAEAGAPTPPWPTTLEALTASTPAPPIPTTMVERPLSNLERASRSEARNAVPGCSGVVIGGDRNGQLPPSELCDLWQRPYQDRADAVITLYALDDAYRARFGTDMCLTSGYRDLEKQAALRASLGSRAAPPGLSNHGWGLAIDFCASTYTGTSGAWLDENGPAFGWANPPWAHRGGGGPYEPWHWEYTSAVARMTASTLAR